MGSTATAAFARDEPAGMRIPIIALTADATATGRDGMPRRRHGRLPGETLQARDTACHAGTLVGRQARRTADEPARNAGRGRSRPSRGPDAGIAAAASRFWTRPRSMRCARCRAAGKRTCSAISASSISPIRADWWSRSSGSLNAGNSADLARAAHAWRSYNGNVGAHALARLCRELEDSARQGDFAAARDITRKSALCTCRVRDELQFEMRRSA